MSWSLLSKTNERAYHDLPTTSVSVKPSRSQKTCKTKSPVKPLLMSPAAHSACAQFTGYGQDGEQAYIVDKDIGLLLLLDGYKTHRVWRVA